MGSSCICCPGGVSGFVPGVVYFEAPGPVVSCIFWPGGVAGGSASATAGAATSAAVNQTAFTVLFIISSTVPERLMRSRQTVWLSPPFQFGSRLWPRRAAFRPARACLKDFRCCTRHEQPWSGHKYSRLASERRAGRAITASGMAGKRLVRSLSPIGETNDWQVPNMRCRVEYRR